MQKAFVKLLFILISVSLSACSTSPDNSAVQTSQINKMQQASAGANASTPPDQNTIHDLKLAKANVNAALIGGSIEKTMDADDKVKMSRALDKAPGKTSEWENGRTGITYAVTPIKKVVMQDNPICREYRTIASKGGQNREMTGVACVAADGNWHTVNS